MPEGALLTLMQTKILRFIKARGYMPTYREIAEAVGVTSTSSIHHQVGQLRAKGVLPKIPRHRAVTIRSPRVEDGPSDGEMRRGGFVVYQLKDGKRTVYVGKSVHLPSRLGGHRDKEWTLLTWQYLPSKQAMEDREADLIHELHPKYNKHCPRCGRIPIRWNLGFEVQCAS